MNSGKRQQPGTNFTQATDDSGAFQTNNFLGQAKPTLASTPEAHGYMIVGKLRNQFVPIPVRTGAANSSVTVPQNGALGPYADDGTTNRVSRFFRRKPRSRRTPRTASTSAWTASSTTARRRWI